MKVKWIVVLVLAIVVSIPSVSMGENTHAFDCSECHNTTGTIHELSGDNVCLKCHNAAGAKEATLFAGSRYNPDDTYNIASVNTFDEGDASDLYNSGVIPDAQTSHLWAVSTTYNSSAGSREPNRTLHPNMFSNYNISSEMMRLRK